MGEQTIFILNETSGKIRYQKWLDYGPSCMKIYHNEKGSEIYTADRWDTSTFMSGDADSPGFSYLLGSFSNYVMVYKDVQLVWTAKTPEAPIFVDITSIDKQKGLIVTLSDTGFLQLSYLGTSPPN